MDTILLFLQFVVTGILVWVTYRYTKSTEEIACLSRKEFTANNRPFVFVSKFFIDNNPKAFRLFLENSGKLPAEIKLKLVSINFYNMDEENSDSPDVLSTLNKMKYYVFPNQKNAIIGYPLDKEFIKKIEVSDGFFLHFVLKYWQIGKLVNTKEIEIIINYRTKENSCDGCIHDMQIVSAK